MPGLKDDIGQNEHRSCRTSTLGENYTQKGQTNKASNGNYLINF